MTRKYLLVFAAGLLATLTMTILMILSIAADVSPMPHPIPVAIMGKIFGHSVPKSFRMVLGFLSHFVYGGAWAILFWYVARPLTFLKGITLGIILWAIMQVIVLPFLGWGVFGSAVTLNIAAATLVLHLVYGGALGLLGQVASRRAIPAHT